MSKYLHAQKLNRRGWLQRRSGAVDEANQPLPDAWETVVKLWCDVNVVSGSSFVNRETIASDREVSRNTASIRIRKREGVTADMRMVVGGVIYEIREVLVDQQDNRFLDLGCASGANRG